jgi:putative ABC transport system permease protein
MAGAGICLGVAAIISIGIVNKSVIHSVGESFNQVTGRAALQVVGSQAGFPEELIEKVRSVPGIECAVPVIETDGLLAAGKERSLMILGVDVLVDTQVRDYSLAGESADVPDPLLFLAKPDSILITRTMAQREGIKLDQTIQVQTVQGIRTFRVRGILDPSGPAKAMGGNLAVMDIYAAQMAFGKEGRIDRIDVSLLRGEDLETVRQRILQALPQGYLVDTPAGRTRQVETMLEKFQSGFNLVSFMGVIVGMYLIYNAVSISVVQRRKEIGILRALGATRRDVLLLFLGETLVISIIASACGVCAGLLLAKIMVGAFGNVISETYVRTEVTRIYVSWTYPALGMCSGICASLVAAAFPACASSRISPVLAIRSLPYSEEGFFTPKRMNIAAAVSLVLSFAILVYYKSLGNSALTRNTTFLFTSQLLLLIGMSLLTPAFLKGFITVFHRLISSRLGVAGRLAGLNLRKNIPRNAVAVAAVFFGIAVFVSTSGFVASVKESTNSWLEAVVRADIMVSSGHPSSSTNAQTVPMPVSMYRELETLPGVLSAEPWRKVFMNFNGRSVLLSTLDIARRLEYTELLLVEGSRKDLPALLPNQENVLVSEPFAAIFGVKPGDSITLATPSGPVRFGVVGVIVDYLCDNGTILMDLNTYQRHWGDMLANSFAVRVTPGSSVGAVRDAIQKRFGTDRKLFVLPAAEFRNEIRKVLDGMFVLNSALTVITLTIACLGIIVTLFASVLERTREIGTLRSIGMLRRQISAVVVLESILMGLAGGLLGSVAGVLSGWVCLEGFFTANYGSAARYYIPYGSILWALALSAGLAALAGMIPARKAAKTTIVEALAYE